MPPVVSSSGSLSISRPAAVGSGRGTGRASTSTTQEPTTTQSNRLSMGKSPAVEELHGAILLLLRQLLFDRGDHFRRIGLCPRRKTSDYLAIAIEQKLLKVPSNLPGKLRIGFLRCQLLIERSGFLTV